MARFSGKFLIHRTGNWQSESIKFYKMLILENELVDLDQIDRKLLALLQQDATLTVAELGERVGLPQLPAGSG